MPIVVKLDESVRADLAALARVTIPSAKGPIMLGQVADMQLGGAPAEINRYDRMRNISYTIELAGASINDISTAAH